MIHSGFRRLAAGSLALLLIALPLAAQEARDPTVAPAETGTIGPSPLGVEGMTVMVRDNKSYLVVGTRLYAPGDAVGTVRVERITETEVWFHDGKGIIKVPRFTGIERKTVIVKPPCAAPLAPNPPPTVAPCEDTPP
jgi:hypothetical protein